MGKLVLSAALLVLLPALAHAQSDSITVTSCSIAVVNGNYWVTASWSATGTYTLYQVRVLRDGSVEVTGNVGASQTSHSLEVPDAGEYFVQLRGTLSSTGDYVYSTNQCGPLQYGAATATPTASPTSTPTATSSMAGGTVQLAFPPFADETMSARGNAVFNALIIVFVMIFIHTLYGVFLGYTVRAAGQQVEDIIILSIFAAFQLMLLWMPERNDLQAASMGLWLFIFILRCVFRGLVNLEQ